MNVNKKQLFKAFKQWEEDHRAGRTAKPDEGRAKPVDQIAQECADHLWSLLCGHNPAEEPA